ncbi:hypothetical protein SUDANB70_00066 [Streptomyces sp. enrichment culture]
MFGDPTAIAEEERNLVRLRFPVASDRGRLTSWPVTPVDAEAADRALVADLRRAAARFPDDPRLSAPVAGRVAGNPRFAALWADDAVGRHAEDRKTIRHPVAGEVNPDCDVLTDGDTDLKIVAYTAVPGSDDASRLALAGIVTLPGSDASPSAGTDQVGEGAATRHRTRSHAQPRATGGVGNSPPTRRRHTGQRLRLPGTDGASRPMTGHHARTAR